MIRSDQYGCGFTASTPILNSNSLRRANPIRGCVDSFRRDNYWGSSRGKRVGAANTANLPTGIGYSIRDKVTVCLGNDDAPPIDDRQISPVTDPRIIFCLCQPLLFLPLSQMTLQLPRRPSPPLFSGLYIRRISFDERTIGAYLLFSPDSFCITTATHRWSSP